MCSSSLIRRPAIGLLPVVVKVQGPAGPEQSDAHEDTEDPERWRETLLEKERHVLEQARRQAAELIAEAAQEADALRARAREQGRQEGHLEGLLAAEASARASVEHIARLAEQARADRRELLRDAEAQIVELALAIARKVVEREVSIDAPTMAPMVRAALAELGEVASARVRVHPEALPLLAQRWAECSAGGGDSTRGGRVALVADEALLPGDCVVETARGDVDARVEAKLAEIAVALDETKRRRSG